VVRGQGDLAASPDTKQALKDLGDTGVKLQGVLKGVGIAAGTLAVLETVGATVDALEKHFDRAVPGVEALTKSLLALGNAEAAQQLSQDIGDLGDALDKLDEGGIKGFADTVDTFVSAHKALQVTAAFGSFGTSLIGPAQQNSRDLREAADAIDAVDSAMANIVTSGSADKAREVFDQLAKAQGLSADQQKQLLALLPQYNDALDAAANQATLTASASDGLTDATGGVGQAASDAAQQIADLVKAMQDQKNAAVDAFDAITPTGRR
jgi:hypothetical protein